MADTHPVAAALADLAAAVRELAEGLKAKPSDSSVPAKGLVTQVRPTPEHRDPKARSVGFAPVKAEEE